MRNITVAATQMACGKLTSKPEAQEFDTTANILRAEKLVREAAGKGAKIILIQELFEAPYFCQDEIHAYFGLAKPLTENPAIAHFSPIAKELGVVLPISVFERAGQNFFNTIAILDADGSNLGFYRKSHIPDGPGYSEKFYFSPGDTGFKVWDTKHARIGVGICWDQWFPETARSLALMGAELLFFPTAIGSEPLDPSIDSRDHWQRTMQGHAAANMTPLIASNRIGTESGANGTSMTFYGSSFIADHTGEKIAEASRTEEEVLTATFDLDAIAKYRASWGIFRDRRPDLYGTLLTLDGKRRHAAS